MTASQQAAREGKQRKFSILPVPDSRASTPDIDGPRAWDEKLIAKHDQSSSEVHIAPESDEEEPFVGIGLRAHEVYDRQMNWFRAAIRRRVYRNVEQESQIIARMQACVRYPFLDTYFVYTSSLGTHTFFMISIPALLFFGYNDVARGVAMVLALGVYVASFVKDYVCAPRPFAPPVTRLTMGNHHLEYGFPSTHSTNSVSIALLFYSLISRLHDTPASSATADVLQDTTQRTLEAVKETVISDATYNILLGILVFYAFSIVYGRLYTGMHSFTDCVMGVALGTAIWAANEAFDAPLHNRIQNSGWIVPSVTVPLCLFLVHMHPQPVDDCPCFEDAIAFISVIMGEILSRWYLLRNGYDETYFVRVMPGQLWGSWMDTFTWWSVAAIKLVVGVLCIFVWRIVAKTVSHLVLPPTFRLLAQAFTLPHRRFYTPATDYKNVPVSPRDLRAVPSVIDLPSAMEMEMDCGGASGVGRPRSGSIYGERSVTQRAAGRARTQEEKPMPSLHLTMEKAGFGNEEPELGGEDIEVEMVTHYDADVLTKVIVYCGIAMIACGFVPIMFEMVGLGVKTG